MEEPRASSSTAPTSPTQPPADSKQPGAASGVGIDSHGVEADGGDPTEAGGASLPVRQRPRAVPPRYRLLEWIFFRIDEQLAKDVQLVDSIAEKQAQIFSEECKLFPADVQIQLIYPLPDIAELELKLSECTKKISNLQQMVQELASKESRLIHLSTGRKDTRSHHHVLAIYVSM